MSSMNIIILGPQGSGKGTQAEKVAQRFDLEHIDMGKFLREVAKMDTPLGREIYQIQNITRTLVPSRILEEAFTIKLNSIPREKGIVFDGVPRNIDQMEYFNRTIIEFGRHIDKVFVINISEEESIKRIAKRRICQKCRTIFILGVDLNNENDACPHCQGKIIQRIDDTEEGIKKRLKVFRDETLPVVEYYQKEGKLIAIDGDKSIESVFSEILENL
jgi:adenylate kinase